MKEYSISEIQKLMTDGKLTAKQLVKKYLERINKIDKSGPTINSIIELNPDALKIAENLDQVRKEDNSLGPLHGIPILIKDNIATADNMMTTAGSLALEGFRSTRDAFIVQKLRAAGAIILGKTNLSEWANFRSTRSTSGWSSRGGQARNPYVLDRSPCGSSSGSATAVAANLCSVSIGTETDGSIVCPAHVNSVVGVKPSIGLVSRTGIIPISHNQDTAGPIARTVEDAAILLNAMVGVDKEDAQSITNEKDIPTDYTEFLDIDGLKDARIGVARNFFGKNELVNQVIDKAIEKMEKAGAIIIDKLMLESVKELREPEYEVLLYDFKNDLNEFLEKFVPEGFPQTMKEIIEFNEKNKEKVMPYFGQEHFKRAEERGPLTDEVYKEALEKCHKYSREEGIDLAIKENKLDAIIAPTGGPAWPMDLVNGDHFTGGSSSLAAVAGYLNITVPVGYVFGLPIGLSFFSGAFQEPTLLKITYAFEQLTKVRKPPSYLKTLEI
ncbi:MAG: amidase [Candidatus Heimdallarchaeota archaeon]|nr:amidase [Candidatus Heimdallarchaeota archaeon]